MAKLQATGKAGFNSGNIMSKEIKIDEIKIDPEISKIFDIPDKVLKEIVSKMKEAGYDESQPIVIWKGTNILVDGHTRLTAAKEAGLTSIPVAEKEFKNKEEALLYTFERQAVRRNLTNAEILTAAKMMPERKAQDGKGRAAEVLAAKLGVSASTIYHARAVLKAVEEAPKGDKVPSQIQKEIKSGKKSLKRGYKDLLQHQNPDRGVGLTERMEFLKKAVVLLMEDVLDHKEAVSLLIYQFLKADEKAVFYSALPSHIIDKLEESGLLARATK